MLESALGESVKEAISRLNDQLTKLTGQTGEEQHKEESMTPLIQHVTAEIAAEGASILSQGGPLNVPTTPAAQLLHAYSQMQLKIGDARLEYVRGRWEVRFW